jgi:hypothetical protein
METNADDSVLLKPMSLEDEATAAIGFRATVVECSVELRWLKGVDVLLWESLCGNVKRLVAPPPPPATAAHTTNTERKRRQKERQKARKRALREGSKEDASVGGESMDGVSIEEGD